jgi:hypothetical protein
MFFDNSTLDDYAPLPTKRKAKRYDGVLKRLSYSPVLRKFSVSPWNYSVGTEVVFDVECYRNYFLCAFKNIGTGEYFYVEHCGEGPLPEWMRTELHRALHWFKIIGFNSISYDIPMIEAACKGATLYELKELSDDIIIRDERKANWRAPYNHIDLIEVAPLEGSLKLYAARLHCKRMQELPIDPHSDLSPQDVIDTRDYCFNDLDNTELLYSHPTYGLKPHVELRERLGAEINQDIRSKSDAQVGEAFINAKIREARGFSPKKPDLPDDYEFFYQPPEYLSFDNPQLQEALRIVQAVPFRLDGSGAPVMPEALSKLSIRIGSCVYKMGMGGLHSSEKTAVHKADDETDLIDRDVVSFYPWLIINSGFFPKHIGKLFIEIFRDGLVLRRMELKKLKDKLEAGLKIAINGIFGKLGSFYSSIFSPDLLIQVTITGQLVILKLIEMIEAAGIPIVSANTDGVIIKCPKRMGNMLGAVIAEWERITSLQTEETRYAAVYSRDVNNYIAIKEDGSTKAKGAYSERGSAQNSAMSKNPEALICSDAVQALLSKGTPIEKTVRACQDIRRFVVVRNVRGGAHKDGYFLGKTIRWYYAEGVQGVINYIATGNKVPNSEGACPLMELPDECPTDIAYEYYIDRAFGMLGDLGYFGSTKQGGLF